jgi:hypothetical protein
MKNSLLKRRLTRLEAKSEILSKTIGHAREAEALRKLSDDELERLYKRVLAGLDTNCRSSYSRSVDFGTWTVDELVALYRWEIRGSDEH